MPDLDPYIGSAVELFVDRHRIAQTRDVELLLHSPRPAGAAVYFDKPWEGPASAYVTVFEDEGRYRMYYRGWPNPEVGDQTCYAESADGISWTKPELGLHDWRGSKRNNILWRGIGAHNFTPFKDTRPDVPAPERYKALGRGLDPRTVLFAFASQDGIRWRLLSDKPVYTDGKFDSQNLAFWDSNAAKYRCYYRTFVGGVRSIAVVESDDFRHWGRGRQLELDPPTREHFYTNAVTPYFRNPAYYFAFPKRFFPKRRLLPEHEAKGVSEAVMMSSRDGVHFDRTFMEAWIRPGRDERNWGDRSTMPAWGLVQTAEDEMSVYYSRHYRFDTAHLERGVLRLDGLASARAGYGGGELTTEPIRFSGRRLVLNYATGAGGSLSVELQNRFGRPLDGFSLAAGPAIYGDRIAAAYSWSSGDDVSSLEGEPIRLRFVLRDCDLYSYRFQG